MAKIVIDVPIEYPFKDPDFKAAFEDYLEMRRRKKYITSDRAIKALLKKTVELSKNNAELAIKIVDQSNIGNWQTFYPLKQDNNVYNNTYNSAPLPSISPRLRQEEK